MKGTTPPRQTEVVTGGTASATPTTVRKPTDNSEISAPAMRRRRLRVPLSSTKTGAFPTSATSGVGAGARTAPGRQAVTPSAGTAERTVLGGTGRAEADEAGRLPALKTLVVCEFCCLYRYRLASMLVSTLPRFCACLADFRRQAQA